MDSLHHIDTDRQTFAPPPGYKFGRRYDLAETVADGIVHGIGVALALVGATALIFYTVVWGSVGNLTAAVIYGTGLVGALGISFTYNMLPHSRLKWVMRRLDHSAIFILIAATYTPFLQLGAHDPVLRWLLIGIWGMAATGVLLKCTFPGRHDRLAILLYLGMGWSGVLAIGSLHAALPEHSLILIVIGGVIYSSGVVFHVWEKLRFHTAIWHGFVVTAAAVHYVAVVTAVSGSLPRILL